MKAKVYVNLKSGVQEPQVNTIKHTLEMHGISRISEILNGKYFEISLAETVDDSQARAQVEKMAREVLSNPIIEDYRVEIEA